MKRYDGNKGVMNALEKWKVAEHYLQNVSDPELVDYAVYESEAARRKYMYMLGKKRKTEQPE